MDNKLKELIEKFAISWEKICSDERDALLKIWDNKSEYTSKILYGNDSIVKKIAKDFSLECYSECRAGYYGIDAVFYEEKYKIENFSGVWLRKIKISLEHENDSSYLFQETSRLLTSNAELKVLISYTNLENNKSKNKLLCDLAKYLEETEDNILLILGHKNKNDGFVWEKYILNENGKYDIVKIPS